MNVNSWVKSSRKVDFLNMYKNILKERSTWKKLLSFDLNYHQCTNTLTENIKVRSIMIIKQICQVANGTKCTKNLTNPLSLLIIWNIKPAYIRALIKFGGNLKQCFFFPLKKKVPVKAVFCHFFDFFTGKKTISRPLFGLFSSFFTPTFFFTGIFFIFFRFFSFFSRGGN